MVNQPGSPVDAEFLGEGTPPPPDRIRLSTVDDVRVELARVYRDMRARRMSMADGTKLAYVLSMLAKVTDQSVLEERLLEMEQQMRRMKGITHAE
jgi:hypothetical protein